MKPTIGRIVHYRLTEAEALATSKRRQDAFEQFEQMRRVRSGYQAHVGMLIETGQTVAMIVTAVSPDEFGPDRPGINGQAILDGTDSLWVTSVEEGEGPGTWSWPPREG